MNRIQTRLHEDFRFHKIAGFFEQSVREGIDLASPEYDDSAWQVVSVPHDWAIGHDFHEDNDCSVNSVLADGITKSIKHSGRTGALPTVGTGFYRKWLDIPADYEGRRLELVFDGIMWQSEIYVNGSLVYKNHFGYRSFSVDITDFVKVGEKNLLAVKAMVYEDCSRWYSGAGIFRNVYLLAKAPDALAYCGIRTKLGEVTADLARFSVELDTVGAPDLFELELCAPSGSSVLAGRGAFLGGKGKYDAKIESPTLWSIEKPSLYTLRITTFKDGKKTDTEHVKLGFRSLRFDPDEGFFLNEKNVKVKGVCLHHDLGVFGAAVNRVALERQLTLMREMGANAIRTSHNPPAPELLELCDKMGLLVIDEFFDEWKIPKVKNGYASYFEAHAEEDVVSVIHRDMNHPCVFLWSIGNEIEEQRRADGAQVAKFLSDICHREDPTRLVTAGLSYDMQAEENGFFDAIDVIGLNYKPHHYELFHKKYPSKIFYGSETASCCSMRGEFFLPAVIDVPQKKREDLSLSDYSLGAPNWAYYAERELLEQKKDPYIFGEFVWTGFDYLGEPTPYYSEWPARSSYFGIFDTAGLPKSRYFLYKSMWSKKRVLHILPHRNFEGHEGENIPVHILTSYDRVELFLNGRSLGIREKNPTIPDFLGERVLYNMEDVRCCRIIYDDVRYEPGELTVVALREDGTELDRLCVKTAGKPYAVRLAPERQRFTASDENACFVRAFVVDKNGTLCPTATHSLHFTVTGAGRLYATDNGDPRDTAGYFSADRHALGGACVAVVLPTVPEGGPIKIRATSDGLVDGEAELFAEMSTTVVQNMQ